MKCEAGCGREGREMWVLGNKWVLCKVHTPAATGALVTTGGE